MPSQSIAIIGGGIVGLTSAYALQSRGHQITVFETANQVALGASYGNAGLIAAASAEAWSSPASIRTALRWLFRADAPLKVHLAWDWEWLVWLSKFAASALSYEANTKALTHLSIAARDPLKAMAKASDAEFDFRRRGTLDLYGSESDRAAAETVVRWMAEERLERRFISPGELGQLEPNLPRSWAFGTHCADDFTGDSKKFCEGLATSLIERGVEFHLRTPVQNLRPTQAGVIVQTSQDQRYFDRVIVANGLGAAKFGKLLGDRLDLYGVKGYSLTLDLTEEQAALAPQHGLLDHDAKIAVSKLGNRLRVAGTAEIGAKDLSLSPERLQPLHDWVQRTLPDLADAPAEEWAGFRPMRAQIRPLLQKSRASDRIIYNVGHGHLGWTLAAASADRLGAII